jgi:hypothetical protein
MQASAVQAALFVALVSVLALSVLGTAALPTRWFNRCFWESRLFAAPAPPERPKTVHRFFAEKESLSRQLFLLAAATAGGVAFRTGAYDTLTRYWDAAKRGDGASQ